MSEPDDRTGAVRAAGAIVTIITASSTNSRPMPTLRDPDPNPAAAPEPLQRAAVGGFSLAYLDVGAGRPCVLVHGFPFDHRLWRAQWTELAGDARWIVPDLRGHGQSDAPPPPYAMRDFADDLRVLIDHLGLERVLLGGQSMGGTIALAFAARYPERLAGLLLVATRAGADPPAAQRARIETATRVQVDGAAAIADGMAARILGERSVAPALRATVHDWIAGTSIEGLAGSLIGMAQRPDSTPLLERIDCPALVVVGSDDHLTPPRCARAMAAAIPGAELLEVPGAGHLVPLERPVPVNEKLRTFLERCAG